MTDEGSALHPARAYRYVLDRPLCYRGEGENSWSIGRIENMSSSGLLMFGPLKVPVGENIELRISLRSAKQPRAGDIVGRARVVRHVDSALSTEFAHGAEFLVYKVAAPKVIVP